MIDTLYERIPLTLGTVDRVAFGFLEDEMDNFNIINCYL